jgi:hypothetical protein
MAKRLSGREVASVRLLVLELSEDELTVLAAALTTLLKERDDPALGHSLGRVAMKWKPFYRICTPS